MDETPIGSAAALDELRDAIRKGALDAESVITRFDESCQRVYDANHSLGDRGDVFLMYLSLFISAKFDA